MPKKRIAKKRMRAHHLKKIKRHIKTLRTELVPHPARSAIRYFLGGARRGFVAIFLLAVLLGMFQLLSASPQNESLQKKLTQASVLALENNKDQVTLLAVGDILLGRYVELQMRRRNDYTWPFARTADFLKSADITFGNLESPFFPGANTPTDNMNFRADLASVKGLISAGFDVVSIANNHIMNFQTPSLTSTIQTLRQAGIEPSGGGKNREAAHSPIIILSKGKRIAFLSYTDPSIPPRQHGITKGNAPGIAGMDLEVLKLDVAKAKGQADFVVVSMHAGKELKKEPTDFQRNFAHAAIDAGASVVIGHHPHVIQPVEEYMDGVIFYSLGNFIFDQFFSEDVQTGHIAKITFEEKGAPKYELIRVKLEKTQPRIVE